jgi:predicted AlkP superfamily phosphohydrolase/phosphomutase
MKGDCMSEMHETNSKILIVGWDGGTWSAFRPLAERGVMPNLKALMDRGAFGVLESTMPAITAPAWTTMMTGLRPETHGIYSFIDGKLFDDPLEPDDQPVSARSVRFPTLLEYFAAAGRRVACINEPMSYPPREVNGIMITGMLTPAGATDFTWPKELTAELDGYVIDLYGGVDWVAQELPGSRLNDEQYVRRCTEILAARARNVCRLAETHPADFTFVVFTGTDRIFHRLWPEVAAYVERSAPEGALEKALEEFFRAMDDALGRVMAACGAAHVMIVSDHGFGPKLPHTVYPNVCLEENGFLVRRAGGSPA